MPKYKDMTGQRVGRLLVINRAANDPQQNAQWLCLCDCGKTKVVRGGALRQRKTLSCGCLHDEKASERMTAVATKHGYGNSQLCRVRAAMLDRCYNPSTKEFHRYGGRGIYVCDEWRYSPVPFYEWAEANGYRNGLQIDRIDNDGPYAPWNCRWVSALENAQNTSRCVRVRIINPKTGAVSIARTISEASRMTGVSQSTISRSVHGIQTKQAMYIFELV